MNIFPTPFFHHVTPYNFIFSFDSLFDVRKDQRRIFTLHKPPTRFFSFYLVLFLNMSQYYYSNDIIRTHDAFSCVVYIIFPFSSDYSLMFKLMYSRGQKSRKMPKTI
jgi:hypothetical protein